MPSDGVSPQPFCTQPVPAGCLSLLFFGDIVGKPGRTAVATYLAAQDPAVLANTVVIANGENVTHGFGLQEKHYRELLAAGVDVVTGGNHTWDRKEIVTFINQEPTLFRPHNMPASLPGTGYGVVTVKGHRVGVLNLIGQVFMGNYNSPWERLEQVVAELRAETAVLFVDFHAEATAEKIALGQVCAELGVSALVGTHTHVQTADEKIVKGQMGYLTDAGFNGAYESVIGMDAESSILRLRSMLPARMDVATTPVLQINAVHFVIEEATGRCVSLHRINQCLHPSHPERLSEGALEVATDLGGAEVLA